MTPFPAPTEHPADELTLRLLGEPELSYRGQPLPLSAPRLQALIAYLHLAGPTPRDELAEVFWPGGGARHVRQALYTLRALPGAECWLDDGPVVAVRARSEVSAFYRHLQAGERAAALAALGDGEPPLLGRLGPGQPPVFTDWLEEQRTALRQAHLQALRDHAAALIQAREPEQARDHLHLARRLDPLDEQAARLLMRAEHAAGNTPESLAAFETLRATLAAELGAIPEPDTLALLREIEGADGAPDDGAGAQARLLTREALLEGDPLCGREDDLAAALERLRDSGRLLLQGLGGMGKSRLARAAAAELLRADERALWLEAGAEPPGTVLAALLEPVGLRAARPSPAQIADALRGAGVGVIVLDNAQSSYALGALLGALPPGVPVLVTSRQRLPRLSRVTLRRLEREASLAVLRHHLGDAAEAAPEPTRDALSAILGDHPYALRLVALTLREGKRTPAELLRALTEARRSPGEYGLLRPLLSQSLLGLDAEAYEAYMGLGALYAPQCTPELLSALLRRPLPEAEQALYTLTTHGLTHRETQPGRETVTYRMHDLTWHEARTHHAHHPQAALHAALALAGANTAHPELLNAELPNLIGAAQAAHEGGQGAELVRLMSGWLGGRYIAARGYPTAHLKLLEAAVQAAEAAADWASAALLWGKFGNVQQALLADSVAATDAYLRGAKHAERAGLLAKATTMTSLAGFLQALTHDPRADQTLIEATDLARRSGDPVSQAEVLEQQGMLHAMGKRFLDAHDALLRGRALLAGLLPQAGPEVLGAYANITNNLGQACLRLGRLDEALTYKQESRQLALRSGEQLLIARAHTEVGEVLAQQGQVVLAREVLTEALTVYRELDSRAGQAAVQRLLAGLPGDLEAPGGQP